MSSRAKKIGQNVKEKQSRIYMNNMYDLFNLSLFQLLKLRHMYRSYMRRRGREQKLHEKKRTRTEIACNRNKKEL